MAQAELDEVAEPGGNGRGGSSAMPHKRNPVASIVDAGRREPPAGPGRLRSWPAWRRSTSARLAAGRRKPSVHAEIMLALSGALDAMIEAADGLRVNPDAMRANIDAMRGLVLAERLVGPPRAGNWDAMRRTRWSNVWSVRGGGARARICGTWPDGRARVRPAMDLDAVFDPAGTTGEAETFTRALLDAPMDGGDAIGRAERLDLGAPARTREVDVVPAVNAASGATPGSMVERPGPLLPATMVCAYRGRPSTRRPASAWANSNSTTVVGQHGRQQPLADCVGGKDVAEAGGDDAAKAGVGQRVDRGLARRAAAEVATSDRGSRHRRKRGSCEGQGVPGRAAGTAP